MGQIQVERVEENSKLKTSDGNRKTPTGFKTSLRERKIVRVRKINNR